MAPHSGSCKAGAVIVCLALAVAGCTTIRPQIIQKDLVLNQPPTDPACDRAAAGDSELALQICQSSLLRLRYLEAAADETTLHNTIGAGLIALSAAGIYKGVTSNSDHLARELAAMGLTGAAAYAYGQNFISPTRQHLYMAGASALLCAIQASRPWLYTQDEQDQLDTALDRYLQDQRALQQAVDVATALADAHISASAAPSSARCVRTPVAGVPTDWQADIAALQDKVCSNQSSSHNAAASKGQGVLAHSRDVLETAAGLGQQNVDAGSVLTDRALQIQANIQGAATALNGRTNLIQDQVNVEVLNTTPDLTRLLGVGNDLRSSGLALTNSALLAPTPVKSQSAASTLGVDAPTQRAVQVLADATDALGVSQAALQRQVELAERKARAAGTVSACRFNPASGLGTVTLVPDLDEIALEGAQSFTWSVYGVPGVPVAQLSGASGAAEVTVTGNGGVAQVKVTLKQALAQGQWLMVTVSDANHLASRDVRIVSAATPASNAPSNSTALLPNRKIAVPPLAAASSDKATTPPRRVAPPASTPASAPTGIKASAPAAATPTPAATPRPTPTGAPGSTRIPTISKRQLDDICRANKLGSNEACYDQIEDLKARCAQTLGLANTTDNLGPIQQALLPGGRCYPQGAS
ncbi:hypothetical protein JCM19000A_01050 [Silvimonas sp. JCM 19000]